MKKLSIFIIGITVVFYWWSCEKFPNPRVDLVSSYFFQLIGNDQKAGIGEFLADSIGVAIADNTGKQQIGGFLVRWKIITGNGSLGDDSLYTNSNGIAHTRWMLGTNSNLQKVLCEIRTPDGKLINQQTLVATATGIKPWDTLRSLPESQLETLVPDYFHHTTFLISGRQLYTYTGTDYRWILCSSFQNMGTPKTIVSDNNGTIYVSTWQGDVFKTADAGSSWIKGANPDPTSPYFVDLAITSNDFLFAATYSQKLYRSVDKAITWQKVDTTNVYLRWVVACTDSVFFRTGMIKSTDQGKTWMPSPNSNSYYGAYSEKDGNLLFINQADYGNSGWDRVICSTSDLLKTYVPLKTISSSGFPQQSFFYKIGSLLYYGQQYNGIYVSGNNKDFQLFWNFEKLIGFFVDHNNRFVVIDGNSYLYYYNQP